jgi:D-amino-acid dehydrogenase
MRMLWASTPSKVEQASKVLAELLDLALAAHHELAREAGVDGDLVRSGWLKVFEDERGFAAAQPEFDVMRRRGVRCDELDGAGIRGLEPSLGLPFSKGIFHAECHHVGDPLLYVQALGRLALHRGLKWRAEEVHGFDTSGGRVTAVQAAHGPIKADAVVIATGAWSKALAAMLGCTVPLDTERGYHMMLDTAECAVQLTRPVYWAEKSIVLSPMGGRVRVTSSVEFAGLKADPDFDLVLRCLPDVQRLLPGAALVPGSTWLGFRPSMPDSLPVIGPVPELSNAVLAFGHGHLGLTLGPITGKLVCDALDGEGAPKVLAPFKPARFATGG